MNFRERCSVSDVHLGDTKVPFASEDAVKKLVKPQSEGRGNKCMAQGKEGAQGVASGSWQHCVMLHQIIQCKLEEVRADSGGTSCTSAFAADLPSTTRRRAHGKTAHVETWCWYAGLFFLETYSTALHSATPRSSTPEPVLPGTPVLAADRLCRSVVRGECS
jgi:hypothetical protein